MEGGLQIRDVATQNIAMGSKLLWNLVSGNSTWSKRVLWKKYFQGHRVRCLDQPPKTTRGSPIFSLCLRALEHFKSKLTWISGNGRRIKIWEDSILGDPPLDQKEELLNIKAWLQNNNLSTLWDIYIWDDDEDKSWKNWNLGTYPEVLEEEARDLKKALQGKTPLKACSKDRRGWGASSGKYTAAKGYRLLQGIPHVP